MNPPIRLLVADDHALERAGIRTTLSLENAVTIVGEAATGDEAQQLSLELKPDVLLLDIQMPGSPAVETLTRLRNECPEIKIVILTAHDSDSDVHGLVSAGAVGYVLKDEVPHVLIRAIRAVMQGDTWFSRPVVEKLARLEKEDALAAEAMTLSEREMQVLQLLVRGWSNLAIAKELCLSEPTVRFHLRSIYSKIGVHSRTEAAIWAVKHGVAGEE